MTTIRATTTWFTNWDWTTAHELHTDPYGKPRETLCGRRMRGAIRQAPNDMPRCRRTPNPPHDRESARLDISQTKILCEPTRSVNQPQ